MASGVHAVALRLKQAKKRKMMQDLNQQQQQLGQKLTPPREALHGGFRLNEPPGRSPRKGHPGGWDAASDVSFQDRPSGIEYRQKADKAYKKWLKKQKGSLHGSYEALDFRKSYILASESNKKVDLLLWFGLAVLVTGTVVSFVGLGEKGFRTAHLRLLGPIMCGAGSALVIIRIVCCCCAKKVKKAAAAFSARDQLAKLAQIQQVVAVHSIRAQQPKEGTPIIPSIQVDPSCESGMKSEATGLSVVSPAESSDSISETDPLVGLPDHQWTTAVIEIERPVKPGERVIHFEEPENWRESKGTAELALSPSGLSPVIGSCSSTSPLRPM